MSGETRLAVVGFALIAVCYGLARFAFGLFLPEIGSELALSARASGLIAGASSIGYCLAILVSAGLTERIGPRATATLAALVAAIGLLGMAAAPNVAVLAAAVLFAGLSTGLSSPPLAAAVAMAVREPRRDRINTTINTGASLGVAVTGPAAFLFAGHWRLALAGFAALSLAMAIVAFLALPSGRMERAGARATIRFNLDLTRLLASAFLMGAASTTVWSFGPLLVQRLLGWDGAGVGMLWTVIGLSGLVGVAAGGLIAAYGLNVIHRIFLGLMALAIVLVATGSDTLALGGAGLFGAAYMTLTGVYLVWGVDALPSRPAMGLTAAFLAVAIGQTLGAPVFGLLLDVMPAFPSALLFAAIAFSGGAFRRPRTEGEALASLGRPEGRGALGQAR